MHWAYLSNYWGGEFIAQSANVMISLIMEEISQCYLITLSLNMFFILH